jgi:hypothetical protein
MKVPRKRLWLAASVAVLVGSGLSFVLLMVTFTSTLGATAGDPNGESIRVLEDSIGLLKWIGGAVVTGLVTAVGLLYRALEKANQTSRQDLLAGLNAREELVTKSLETSIQLQERVQDLNEKVTILVESTRESCPHLRKAEKE